MESLREQEEFLEATWPILSIGHEKEKKVMQYFSSYYSGVFTYESIRRPGEESDAKSSRETSSGGSSDCEADRRAKGVGDGSWSRKNFINLNCQGMNRLSLREKPLVCSSSDETETCTSPGTLLFEYLEQEPPHNRKPLPDKAISLIGDYSIISVLFAQFPKLGTYRYLIYRIPMGPTLKDLDASFLTFHSLSTKSGSNGQSRFHCASGRKVHGGVNASSKISLPVFGLAS
ncbi:uncharacterized protein LOC130779511 [Actinidia eriantha]|uniref:uncharacterized protein LOC130779511 n=1 Tax=Actinidia eriantha TaxID=165200 RepID=UPI0025846CF7|nr:uncharacterized protein LOC130779511 [Actinidia eriantha]